MGRIVVTEFISLDGVIEAPGGGEEYAHAGWTFTFDRGDDGDKFKLDEAFASDALLLGRVTYDGFAAAWPTMTGDFADKFNGMPKYVVSATLTDPTWTNTTVIGADDVAGLRKEFDGDLVVHGSSRLVALLIEHDLVDELRLMVFPIVLGSGKRLFADWPGTRRLALADSRSVGEGIAVLTYTAA